jgi:hypothetical protein
VEELHFKEEDFFLPRVETSGNDKLMPHKIFLHERTTVPFLPPTAARDHTYNPTSNNTDTMTETVARDALSKLRTYVRNQ